MADETPEETPARAADDVNDEAVAGAPGDAADDERLPLVAFASACALAPDRVRKFVWLGLIDPVEEHDDDFVFVRRQVVAVERIERLRHGLSISYRAVGVVVDLLDRIDALESELRTLRPPSSGARPGSPPSGARPGSPSGEDRS